MLRGKDLGESKGLKQDRLDPLGWSCPRGRANLGEPKAGASYTSEIFFSKSPIPPLFVLSCLVKFTFLHTQRKFNPIERSLPLALLSRFASS